MFTVSFELSIYTLPLHIMDVHTRSFSCFTVFHKSCYPYFQKPFISFLLQILISLMASKWISYLRSSSFFSASASFSPSSYSPFSPSAGMRPTLVATVTAAPTPVSKKNPLANPGTGLGLLLAGLPLGNPDADAEVDLPLANPDAGMGLLLAGLPFANPIAEAEAEAEVGLPLPNPDADLLDLPPVRRVENVRRRAGLRLRRGRTLRVARRRRQPHANGLYDDVIAMTMGLVQALIDERAARDDVTLELEKARDVFVNAEEEAEILFVARCALKRELFRERCAASEAAKKVEALIRALEETEEEHDAALSLELDILRITASGAVEEAIANISCQACCSYNG